MKSLAVIFIFFAVSLNAQARDLSLIYKNNRAVELAQKEKRQEAFDQFVGLTATDPSDIHLAFNVATSMQSLGQEEKAIKIYANILANIDRAEKTEQDKKKLTELQSLRFYTHFNKGASHQILQQTKEALAEYQLALVMAPESKEIKTNIEMLFAGGEGGGKGKDKEKKQEDQQKNGEGDGEPEDKKDEKEKSDQEKLKEQQEQQQKKESQKKPQPKEFDQKHMSNEDLKRIMDELKDQEQKIRAKMERKGTKNAPKDKEW